MGAEEGEQATGRAAQEREFATIRSQLAPALLEQAPAMLDLMTAPAQIFQGIASSLLSIDDKMPAAKPGVAF
jgi:hypothetical protein